MACNASSVAILLRRLQRPRDIWRLQPSFLEKDVPQWGQSNDALDGSGDGGGATTHTSAALDDGGGGIRTTQPSDYNKDRTRVLVM